MLIREFSSLNKEVDFLTADLITKLQQKNIIFCNLEKYYSYLLYNFLIKNIPFTNNFSFNDDLYKKLAWCNIILNGLDIPNHLKITNLPAEKIYSYKKNSKDIDVNKEIEYINSIVLSVSFLDKKNINDIKTLFKPIFDIEDEELRLTGEYTLNDFLTLYKSFLLSKIKSQKNLSNEILISDISQLPSLNIQDFDNIFILGVVDVDSFDYDYSTFSSFDNVYISYYLTDNNLPFHPHASLKSLNILKEVPLSFLKLDSSRDFSEFKNLKNHDTQKYFNNGLAVTKIERFKECPFSFWLSVLNKTPISLQSTPALMGSACHKLISLVLKDLINNKISLNISNDELLNNIKSKLPEVTNEFTLDKTSTISLQEKVFETLKFTLTQLSKSKFKIIASEIKIDEVSNLILSSPAIGDIKITGIIDRIDAYEENGEKYLNLIDYKTGNDNFSVNSLQLLLYAASLSDKNRISGVYCSKISDAMIDLEKENSSKFKLNGLTIDNMYLKMDDNLKNPSYSSEYIQAKTNKDGSLSKTSKIIPEIELINKIEQAKLDAIEVISQIIIGISKANFIETKCKVCQYNFICK